MMEEHAIGEIFTHRGKLLKVIESGGSCTNCFFNDKSNHECLNWDYKCLSSERYDEKYVCFKHESFKFGK